MPVGILDAATEVKMKQDVQAARADEFARREAESKRRFDIHTETQKENTAWTRSQEERKMAEDQRRFDLSQQASARAEQRAARAEQRADRQLSLQEFGAELSAMRLNSAMASDDIERQKSRAQLDQYLAATEEEKQTRANRERIAKGAFGSLIIAGRLNGGIIPTKALEIANRELGDKDTQIVGGGFDEQTGIAFFNVKNLKDGSVKQLNMTPENQYAAIHGGIGKQEADMFYETFKTGSAARAGIERKRLEYQEKWAYDLAKEQARLQAERSDPIKQAEMLEKQADRYIELAGATNKYATKEQRDLYNAKASEYLQRAFDLRDSAITGGKQQKKAFALTDEMRNKYNIPPVDYRVFPSADGGYTVAWKVKGQTYKQSFAPGEW